MLSSSKQIKERESQELPYYVKEDEMRAILYNDMKINNSKYSIADVCFVCDTSWSMNRYIIPIRDILIDFLSTITELINTRPRVAFIGYKDKKDKNQIKSKGFTTKYEEMIDFIKEIECEGGDDTCEDIVTPLREALKLDWSSDLKYVYLITDSPTHGTRYHEDKCLDDYPDDDKDKLLEKLAVHYRKSKLNLGVLRCNDSVDIMIDIIRKYYNSRINKLRVINIINKELLKEDFVKHFLIILTEDFDDFLAQSREKNFARVTSKSSAVGFVEAEYELTLETSFNGRLNTGSITNLKFEDKQYNYNLNLTRSSEISFKISSARIGTGIFAECYPLHAGGDTGYVAKLPRIPVSKPEELLPKIEGTLFAKYFADKFNNFLKLAEKRNQKSKEGVVKSGRIQVLPLLIVEDNTKESGRSKIFLAQKLLEGEYIKFNNNYGWKREGETPSNPLAQAFSHFTYEFSMGLMMVTNIQGMEMKEFDGEPSGLMIIDPAIHSYVLKGHFGKKNHGKVGMIKFFKTHKCNVYCRMLCLMNPREIDKSKLAKIKEEHKGKEKLKHLYAQFEHKIEAWRKKIQFFDPNKDPELAFEESEEDSTVNISSDQ